MSDGPECEACALADGRRPLPGGLILARDGWRVEHCVGPLGLGSLIVKPRRHVMSVSDLTDAEAAVLGPLLRDAAVVARELVDDVEQVYQCLWSHANGVPVHIHYVVQPITRALLDRHGSHGPVLQVMMFAGGDVASDADVDRVCDQARRLFAALS